MPHISLRVTEEEKAWIEQYALLSGSNLSDIIKMAFFEKLEEEYDLKIAREHEKNKEKGLIKYHSHNEVKRELGLDDVL